MARIACGQYELDVLALSAMRSSVVLLVAALFSLIGSAAMNWAQGPVVGALEDVPGSYAGEPNSRRVRVLFEKKGTEWQAFPSQCSDEACYENRSLEIPTRSQLDHRL